MEIRYLDPTSKQALSKNAQGDLCPVDAPERVAFAARDGSYDFAQLSDEAEEREYYDKVYAEQMRQAGPLELAELQAGWNREPADRLLLESLGDLRGRKVLIIGNGTSVKELYFAVMGAYCVYTDLSIKAVECVKHRARQSELGRTLLQNLEFHAVDAMSLPFADGSFDVIYGSRFVHHVEHVDHFLAEVRRCLKPDGICRFLDDAYSPIWQTGKRTLLRPLQRRSHRKHGISPEDLRATHRGGYRHDELEGAMSRVGFTDLVYERRSFFRYILCRGVQKLGGRGLFVARPLAEALDAFLLKHTRFIQAQGIRLVWGYRRVG